MLIFAGNLTLERRGSGCKRRRCGECYVANFNSADLLSKEKAIIHEMLRHLQQYDTNHRIIFIQVENEINMKRWTGGKENILRYMNDVAAAVKDAENKIATRANIFALSGRWMRNLTIWRIMDEKGIWKADEYLLYKANEIVPIYKGVPVKL